MQSEWIFILLNVLFMSGFFSPDALSSPDQG